MPHVIEGGLVIVGQKIQYTRELPCPNVLEPFKPNFGHNKQVNCTGDGNQVRGRCVQDCEIHK